MKIHEAPPRWPLQFPDKHVGLYEAPLARYKTLLNRSRTSTQIFARGLGWMYSNDTDVRRLITPYGNGERCVFEIVESKFFKFTRWLAGRGRMTVDEQHLKLRLWGVGAGAPSAIAVQLLNQIQSGETTLADLERNHYEHFMRVAPLLTEHEIQTAFRTAA